MVTRVETKVETHQFTEKIFIVFTSIELFVLCASEHNLAHARNRVLCYDDFRAYGEQHEKTPKTESVSDTYAEELTIHVFTPFIGLTSICVHCRGRHLLGSTKKRILVIVQETSYIRQHQTSFFCPAHC